MGRLSGSPTADGRSCVRLRRVSMPTSTPARRITHPACSGARTRDDMNDHFWPSLYTGIIVGALVGLTFGGIVSTLAGALGGTAGAAAMYAVTAWLGLEESI